MIYTNFLVRNKRRQNNLLGKTQIINFNSLIRRNEKRRRITSETDLRQSRARPWDHWLEYPRHGWRRHSQWNKIGLLWSILYESQSNEHLCKNSQSWPYILLSDDCHQSLPKYDFLQSQRCLLCFTLDLCSLCPMLKGVCIGLRNSSWSTKLL